MNGDREDVFNGYYPPAPSSSEQPEGVIDAAHFTTPDGKEWWYWSGEWSLVGDGRSQGQQQELPQGPTLSGIQDASDTVAGTGSDLPKPASPSEKQQPLNCDRDPVRWAREFNEAAATQRYPYDEGWLIGWFANAMMCGEDTYRWRQEAALATTPASGKVPEGMVLVPYEPTDEMVRTAALSVLRTPVEDPILQVKTIYYVMLAAAPKEKP